MRKITLELNQEQAEHLSHWLASSWDVAAKNCIAANAAGDKEEERRQFKAAQIAEVVKDEIDTKGRQQFIGW